MDASRERNISERQPQPRKTNENIQVYVRCRPLNSRERSIRSAEVVDVMSPREIITRHSFDSKLTKKFTFDRAFGPDSRQVDIYSAVVSPLIEEVLAGYNCTVFAYGQTGTGKTHTMVGTECPELKSSWEDDSDIGIIPRALSHLFDELRMMELEFTMRISYLELYNEELCDLLSTDESVKIRIFDDTTKKGSVIIQGLEEIPVHSKDDVYKLLEMGKDRRKTAQTLMNAQSSRSHTVFSIVVHIRENGIDGEDMLKIGKLNLVDLAGSENVSKAGNEKGIRVRETVNINQSLLTLGRVITALVERTPHIPYRESKLTRLLQESLGGRTKTSIIATISPGHKDIEETLSTLEYAHRAKNIQNRPEVNQKLAKKTVLKEYTEEIDKLKRDLMAARDKNGIYLAAETYNEMTFKMDSQNRELNEKMLHLKALKDELANKEKIFNEVSMSLITKTEELRLTSEDLSHTKSSLLQTKQVLNNTTRLYKEKKILLASHVKTEEELTTQATQILAVADMATSDTQKLHHTIERRKDVDDKIRSACESFTSLMEDTFEKLDGSLATFEQKHNSSAQLLANELKNCSTVQNRLLSNSKEQIDKLKQTCLDGFAKNAQLEAEFTKCVSRLTEEQRTELTKLFNVFKSHEENSQGQILATVDNILSYTAQHQTNLDVIRETTFKIISENSEAVSAHTREMQEQLGIISALSEDKSKKMAQLQMEIDNKKALENQQNSVIENFMRDMQQFKELRTQRIENKTKFLSELNESEKSSAAQLQQSCDNVSAYEEQRQLESKEQRETTRQQVETALLAVNENVAECFALKRQLEDCSQDHRRWVTEVAAAQNAHCKRVQEASDGSRKQVKRLRLESEAKIGTSCAELSGDITEAINRANGHVHMTEAYLEESELHLTEYAGLHKDHLMDATKKVSGFKKSKLTYSSTGATPSKRDFKYPRVFAATSPHQEIVRRYRDVKNWPDLDMTIPLDETCEDVRDENSVQEFSSIDEPIVNSIPSEMQQATAVQENRAYDNNAEQRTANTLNPPPVDTSRCVYSNSSVTPTKPNEYSP